MTTFAVELGQKTLIMEKEDIHDVSFDQIGHLHDIDYIDDGIAFHRDVRELPIVDGSLRMDMYIMLICISGKMQVEINTVTYTIQQRNLLIFKPNDLIDNWMETPDFEGGILCVSQKVLLEYFSESDLWDRAFHFAKNPVIHIDEDALPTFKLYGELLRHKIEMKRSLYRKEIVLSIVRAIFYELLANAGNSNVEPYGNGLIKQSEVLFKRFIELLTSCRIKPRSVSWYADQLCVTPKHLSTVCKQVSGKTAFTWINEFMLMDIRHLLKNSSRSIKEIAEFLQFPNISFFGKYCRQHFGVSPTEYRRQLRAGE